MLWMLITKLACNKHVLLAESEKSLQDFGITSQNTIRSIDMNILIHTKSQLNSCF